MITHPQDIAPEEEARLNGRVCGLRFVRRENGFVRQGRTPTYHAEQLVRHAAMQASALPHLD